MFATPDYHFDALIWSILEGPRELRRLALVREGLPHIVILPRSNPAGEIDQWLSDNVTGRFRVALSLASGWEVGFENADDAFAFRMRWT